MTRQHSTRPRYAWLWWSSGKDSAWALHVLSGREDLEVTGLVTTFSGEHGRVAMHGVSREWVRLQAQALGLPLYEMAIPAHCSNQDYAWHFQRILRRARDAKVEVMAFGDLFLADVRTYREELFRGSGVEPIFPLWGRPTAALAHSMVEAGQRAVLVCLDTAQLDADFAGRTFDGQFLRDLPPHVDPCGENGEFHTLVFAGPLFNYPLTVRIDETIKRDAFLFTEVLPG